MNAKVNVNVGWLHERGITTARARRGGAGAGSRRGTGNISGIATAVTMGGPGAVFWMWVSGLFGMSTKAAEIILGQRYRVKYTEAVDEYVCDRSFVMKNSLGWKKGGMVLAFFCFVAGPWTCMVQSEAVVNSLNGLRRPARKPAGQIRSRYQ